MTFIPDEYYSYEYNDSKFITKTYKTTNRKKLWASDIFKVRGDDSLMSQYEFELIHDSGVIKNVIHIGNFNSLKKTHPELLI